MDNNYLNIIKDTDYSISYSYMNYDGFLAKPEFQGEQKLTENGNKHYKSGNFGVVCGDKYLKQYIQGVMMISSVNLVFGSAQQKKDYLGLQMDKIKDKSNAGMPNAFSKYFMGEGNFNGTM